MKSEQEQTEEMAILLCGLADTDNKNICGECKHRFGYECIKSNFYAEKLYKNGYRKANDIVDEYFNEIINKLEYYKESELFDSFSIRLIVNEIRTNLKTKYNL